MTHAPYIVGWTAPMAWWEWTGLLAGCALLWPLPLAAMGLEALDNARWRWIAP